MGLKENAQFIVDSVIKKVLPDTAVKRALREKQFDGPVHLIAIGKAAYQMASAAKDELGDKIQDGYVITKYNHVKDNIDSIICLEASHPVPSQDGIDATEKVLNYVETIPKGEDVLFLVSGGGSALFESPLVPLDELMAITDTLLSEGADIVEINTIRKRLSKVKGGKFAKTLYPRKVYSIVLSDIINDPLDMIASGPCIMDSSTREDALQIIEKYKLNLSKEARTAMEAEPLTEITNVETVISGSVSELCRAAKESCEYLGYETVILTDCLHCIARDAGSFMGSIARTNAKEGKPMAFIAGGETLVKITGKGLGGRNQEIALSAADEISGLDNVCVFSISSDGTDGPTDAAGGYVDGHTKETLLKEGIAIQDVLNQNDSYHALEKTGELIKTGPTGTNVNDVAVILIDRN